MPPTLLRFGQVLMLLVLFAAAGGHWMLLQSLAWTRMLVSYSRNGPIAEAVTKTFDGRHPCSLCKQIAQGKSGESQPVRDLQVDSYAVFVMPARITVARGEGFSWMMDIPEWHGEARAEQPTAPPPRSVLA